MQLAKCEIGGHSACKGRADRKCDFCNKSACEACCPFRMNHDCCAECLERAYELLALTKEGQYVLIFSADERGRLTAEGISGYALAEHLSRLAHVARESVRYPIVCIAPEGIVLAE